MGKECVYIGQTALYRGPFKSVKDDDGHEFERGKPLEVCTDTAARLSKPPYRDFFIVNEPKGKQEAQPCCPEGTC